MPLVRKGLEKIRTAPAPEARLDAATVEERWAAARAAPSRPEAIPALAVALDREEDGGVREAILTALARIGTPQSAAAVLPHLRSDAAGVRTAALDALRAMPEAAAAYLPELLADPDSDVRLLSCELARAIRSSQAAALLQAQIDGETQANVCGAAIEVLSDIGDVTAIPAIVRCAARFPDDPFLTFASKAATARLGGHGDE